MSKTARWSSLVLLCLTGILLIALQLKPFVWFIWLAGVLTLALTPRMFARHMLLIYVSLALLGITPITTDISILHMLEMGLALALAVCIPYVATRYIYKDHVLTFPWHHGRKWYRKEVGYIVFTAAISYFLLPFYLRNTGAYLNWSVEPGVGNIFRLFLGTNALGIWDELFFVCTVLSLLRKYFSFFWANMAQSVLFTSFLFELGFTGWGPIMIFIFALLQGYVFNKTHSLLYVITIHLTLDFVLFLALIEAHHPTWLPIFVT